MLKKVHATSKTRKFFFKRKCTGIYEYSTSYMGHLNNVTGEWDIQLSYK